MLTEPDCCLPSEPVTTPLKLTRRGTVELVPGCTAAGAGDADVAVHGEEMVWAALVWAATKVASRTIVKQRAEVNRNRLVQRERMSWVLMTDSLDLGFGSQSRANIRGPILFAETPLVNG